MDEEQNGQSFKTLIVMLLIFLSGMTATVSLAGSPEPEAAARALKRAEKTCKQLEVDHEKMKGEHQLMFKAWQEKSSPLLTEDEKVFAECRTTFSALKEITEQISTAVSDDPANEKLINDYEKMQSIMEDISVRHKTLREKHERLFHEMMGH
ncbi:MAG: hypothetical protein IT393_04970 [Nitrospirae bacterium]|nr:hypothetical protein [Nitrospirota bacterium]